MSRQTYAGPMRWLVLDDGAGDDTPTTLGQTVIRRKPGGGLPAQMRAAWQGGYVTGSIILFIEDDDYYPPCHVQRCVDRLQHLDLWGENPYRVYHVSRRRAGEFTVPGVASALARTACRLEVLESLPPHFWEADCISLDIRLWKLADCRKRVETLPDGGAVVGMKGMPGRRGLTPGHDSNLDEYRDDPHGETLRRWIGDDAEHYLSLGRHT